ARLLSQRHRASVRAGSVEQGCRAGPALLQHRDDVAAPARDPLAVAPGAHALVLMDQAGWHRTGKLEVPPTSASCATGQAARIEPGQENGNPCATTGSRTAPSHLTTTLSTIAPKPGTRSSISHRASWP